VLTIRKQTQAGAKRSARVRGRKTACRSAAGTEIAQGLAQVANKNRGDRPMRSFVYRCVCAVLLAVAAGAALASPPDQPYTVKPGDTLLVSVWREPELQHPVLVEPDGTFAFPLCGQINARDKTVGQLQQEITQHLAHFITDPVVTVSLQKISGNRIYVIGQVKKPGAFVVNPRVDVMQAISMAGGTTPFASLGNIKIIRRMASGQQEALPFNYNDVIHGNDLDQNVTLEAGDVVVVP
jgi:polysaccharide biosynthesis/export protein